MTYTSKEPPPSVILECSDCHEEVEVMGAITAVSDPYVCVQCLDPRHKSVEKLLEEIMS